MCSLQLVVVYLHSPLLYTMDDDDWEYEYHDSDTDSFFLTLDLSSQGPLRPRHTTTTTTATTTTEDEHETDFARPLTTTESDHHPGTSTDRLQILALHTLNPIVSYQNQIFTCSWADLLGTELLFTSPQELDSESDSVLRGRDYDLLAANSVKILGRKANLISSSGVTVSEPSTSAAGTPTTTNQARFLDRLAAIKQDRGEPDTVRTVFSTRRSQNTTNPEDRLRGWARTEEQMLEIQRLQDAVLRGDSQALAALEEML